MISGMKPTVQIENWRIVGNLEGAWLVGTVKNHPHLDNGAYVKTSPIMNILETGEVETRNTVYQLGKCAIVDLFEKEINW